MASLNAILKDVFGVKAISPVDPGIIKLADLRSGSYPGVGEITITPQNIVDIYNKVIPDPLKTLPDQSPGFVGGNTFQSIGGFISQFAQKLVPGSSFFGEVGAKLSAEPPPPPPAQGGSMAFSDGDSGFSLDNFFGGLGQVLQGGLGQQLLGVGTQALTGLVQQQFGQPQVLQTSMAAVPAIVRGGAMVGRSFFNRFPNLATAIQGYLNRGIAVNRSKLWSLLKRFGPDFLISGGILTAAAVSELTIAGPGRRRMNAGNVKALRRAHRRMKAFHNVCRSNDMLLGGSKRRKVSSSGQSFTKITQVK